jgi:ribosomal protein L15
LTIRVHAVSRSAKEKVEKAGGRVELIKKVVKS